MKVKRIIFCLLLLGVCGVMYSQEDKTVKITVHFSPMYGSGDMEIYNGSYQDVAYIMNELSRAKRIFFSFTKEALLEGEYTIDVYQNSSLIQSYTIFNSQDVYDKTRDRYLRSTILTHIRGEFLYFLLRDRLDPSI